MATVTEMDLKELLRWVREGTDDTARLAAREVIERFEAAQPTLAPDVANAAPEEEALRILNDCVAKLSRITRHAGKA